MSPPSAPHRLPLRAYGYLGAVLVCMLYLGMRFSVGIDDQVHRCLPPYRVWLIDHHDRMLQRGMVYSFFAADQMAPGFHLGQKVIKRFVGLAGDRVTVSADTVRVNGLPVGGGPQLARRLGQPPERFIRELVLPPGTVWAMGDTDDSFDSRYWGALPVGLVRGRAYALW